MNIFTKIYGTVLVLFVVVVSAITLQESTRRIVETEKMLLDKQRITGSLVTSEIQRWHAEGKWPFEALRNLAHQDDFLFWWIVAEDDSIYLADNVEYVGGDTGSYFSGEGDSLLFPENDGAVALNRGKNFGVFRQAFSVGSERWTFWLGFSTAAVREEKNRIISTTLLYSLFGLCFLGAVLFVMMRRFLRPLKDLSQGAKIIGQGALDCRVAVRSEDEIGTLSRAFNQMAESLQKDVARREQMEKTLKDSEELYRSLVENINMGITLIDQDHTIVMTNSGQGKMFDKDPKSFVGKKCYEEFEKRESLCPHCPGVTAMETGLPQETVAEGKRDDGSTLTVSIKAFPLQTGEGQRRGFIEVVDDITEKMKAQEELAAGKERLAVALRSIGDGVITTDTDGRIELLNKVAEHLTGWSTREAAGRPLLEVFHIINEHSRETCENPVEKVLGTGQVVGLANHTVLIARDGTERSIADSGAPIVDAKSKVIGVVLVFRDVTDQIRTEKELLKVKKLESIGVLAGGIAHDFNNILAAILGNINLALYEEGLPDTIRERLADAEKASLRAKGLTQQLLTFAKGGEPVKEVSSLEGVIRDSASFVLHGDKVACRFEIPEDLWKVDIDKGQISQVIQNIVLNASHAMPEGGSIRIACRNLTSVGKNALPALKRGSFVEISIRDSGIGMPEGIVEKIFDPYFTTKQHGSGLGLAITQSIIQKHGGAIVVESSPGAGSTFTLYLPATGKVPLPVKKGSGSREPSREARVLMMDDEEMVRSVAGAMLTALGHEVALSENGEEAIRLYRESVDAGHTFDLVIMDLTVPGGLGGEAAVKELLKIDPQAKVIVSSGYSNDPIMANFKNYGFCAAIVKPYQIQELSKVLSELLA